MSLVSSFSSFSLIFMNIEMRHFSFIAIEYTDLFRSIIDAKATYHDMVKTEINLLMKF